MSIPANEYEELKGFVAAYSGLFFNLSGLAPELRPLAQIELLENRGAKMALQGVRQAANDCFVMAGRLDSARTHELEVELKNKGLPPLAELRQRHSKEYARIVSRGKIRTETEYYLIKSVLDDTSLGSDDERLKLVKLLREYEESRRK